MFGDTENEFRSLYNVRIKSTKLVLIAEKVFQSEQLFSKTRLTQIINSLVSNIMVASNSEDDK
jgi:hypothetical protein